MGKPARTCRQFDKNLFFRHAHVFVDGNESVVIEANQAMYGSGGAWMACRDDDDVAQQKLVAT